MSDDGRSRLDFAVPLEALRWCRAPPSPSPQMAAVEGGSQGRCFCWLAGGRAGACRHSYPGPSTIRV